ncbi:hypothetical protein LCGC14_1756430 [marine sediment metagenome]|uniref:Uncharacterized protein n=1 Tax=marine sediment metagenome TaxID=412755 RepID=A0A0F9JHF5_9ZZZZ
MPSDYFEGIDEDALLEIDDTGEQALLARIPLQSGSSKKALYLSYRATGFPVRQACALTEIDLPKLHKWRKQDPQFKKFEDEQLDFLQQNVAGDVIRLEFLRNFRMILKKDMRVIRKALFEPDELSDHEEKYFFLIRKHYTANDLLSLEKAVAPEKHRELVNINLTWGQGITVGDVQDPDAHPEIEATVTEYKELQTG